MAPPTIVFTVDRIEFDQDDNEIAVLVLDDGQQLNLPLDRLPDGAREGSVLRIILDLDLETEAERRAKVRSLQARLFGNRFQTRE